MSQRSGGHKCPTPKDAPPDPNSPPSPLCVGVLCGLPGPTRESVSPKKRRACTGPPPKGLALWAARPIIIDLAPLHYGMRLGGEGESKSKFGPNQPPSGEKVESKHDESLTHFFLFVRPFIIVQAVGECPLEL